MTVLITGSEGFLGLYLARRLQAAGKKVVGLDMVKGDAARPWPVVTGDVTDAGLIDRLFDEHGVTDVVHVGLGESFDDGLGGVAEVVRDLTDGEAIVVSLSGPSVVIHREHPFPLGGRS